MLIVSETLRQFQEATTRYVHRLYEGLDVDIRRECAIEEIRDFIKESGQYGASTDLVAEGHTQGKEFELSVGLLSVQ